MQKQQTRDLFVGFVGLANAVAAGLDEEADDAVSDQIWYLADELLRRLAGDESDEALAMRAVINTYQSVGLAPREIADFSIGAKLGTEYRELMIATINRAPSVANFLS